MKLRGEAAATLVAIDSLVDDVLLRTLEPAIVALDRLFDRARYSEGDGEPDGFDGLDRRGPLERLLPTEWLLAAEEPDDFIRRYEARELGYLHLRRAVERSPQTALVLFDTGPDQLGRPRIAQLATLVVLGRRAAAAGAELRWGALQGPERHMAAGSAALERFLAARTLDRPAELPLDAFVDDCLVVSPLPGPPFPARQLILTDEGEAIAARLVDRRDGADHTALIPMPASADGVRLLRNPTGTGAAAAVQRHDRGPVSNLVFDERGHKLLARIEPHRLALYPVPNSSNDKPGRIRYVTADPAHGVIAAAGRVGRAVIAVNIIDDGSRVVVRNFGGNATKPTGIFRLTGGPIPPPASDAPLGTVAWVDHKLRVTIGAHRLTQTTDAYRVDPADLSLRSGPAGLDLAAVPEQDGWVVRYGGDEWWYRDGPVVGIYLKTAQGRGTFVREPRIIVVDTDGCSLVSVAADGSRETLYRAGELILDAVAHPYEPLYAVRTASGRVVVRSRLEDATYYEAVPG